MTPIMWQLADLARWLDPRIIVLAVVHSPRATPSLQERGLLREMAQHSRRLIVMTWFGWHSLVAAYGIPPQQAVFIPHGVDVPEQPAPTQDAATLRGGVNRLVLRQLLASSGKGPQRVSSSCVASGPLQATTPRRRWAANSEGGSVPDQARLPMLRSFWRRASSPATSAWTVSSVRCPESCGSTRTPSSWCWAQSTLQTGLQMRQWLGGCASPPRWASTSACCGCRTLCMQRSSCACCSVRACLSRPLMRARPPL